MKMKNDVNNTTEKLGVSKDEASSSDNKENRNTEIVNISMTVKRWYSVANLIYSLLVGYVWVRYIIENCQSGLYGWLRLLRCLRWRLLGLWDDATSINGKRGIPSRPKVVREPKVPVLTSHAGLNPRSKSGNESCKAGEASFLIRYRTDTARYHKPKRRVVKILERR